MPVFIIDKRKVCSIFRLMSASYCKAISCVTPFVGKAISDRSPLFESRHNRFAPPKELIHPNLRSKCEIYKGHCKSICEMHKRPGPWQIIFKRTDTKAYSARSKWHAWNSHVRPCSVRFKYDMYKLWSLDRIVKCQVHLLKRYSSQIFTSSRPRAERIFRRAKAVRSQILHVLDRVRVCSVCSSTLVRMIYMIRKGTQLSFRLPLLKILPFLL